MAVAPIAALGLGAASTVMQVSAARKAAEAADYSAYLAPIQAEVEATRLETKANWIEFSAALDQKSTENRLVIMQDLSRLQRHSINSEAIRTRQRGQAEQQNFEKNADAVEAYGAEDRVRMEKESFRALRSMEARYAKSGVVQDSGSAAIVGAEAQARAELAEQDQYRRTMDQSRRLRHEGELRRYRSEVEALSMEFDSAMVKYSTDTQIHQERIASEIRALDYSNEARNARTDAMMTRARGTADAYAYGQQAKGARIKGAATAVQGAYDFYQFGYDQALWG